MQATIAPLNSTSSRLNVPINETFLERLLFQPIYRCFNDISRILSGRSRTNLGYACVNGWQWRSIVNETEERAGIIRSDVEYAAAYKELNALRHRIQREEQSLRDRGYSSEDI